MSSNQRTIAKEVQISGIGLHTGEKVNLTLCPAPDNHGYKFQRTDLPDEPLIKADPDNVCSTRRGTSLQKGNAIVHTTEHVLAAVYGSKIDNLLFKVDGPEIPILDGSALPFVEAIEQVGFLEQKAERKYLVLEDNIAFEENNVEMLAVPTDGGEFRITVMVDYNSPVLGTQHASMYSLENFVDEIAGCRTFVFLKELAQLAEAGLIKGGDMDNAIILVEREYGEDEIQNILKLLGKEDMEVKVDGVGVLNTTALKYENEPARHKLLDIVGDLALVGKFIRGHILAARPGHEGNVAFAKILKELDVEAKKAPVKFDLLKEPLYNINDIQTMLPHRYPFLLIDKIMEMDSKRIIGVKNITFNEPFFQGHFPGNPVMPGVLQIEAMAQVGGIFALSQVPDPENYSTYFLKIDKVKFKLKVVPGDTLVFDLRLVTPIRRGLVHMAGIVYSNGKPCCEAEMMAQVVKEKNLEPTPVEQ